LNLKGPCVNSIFNVAVEKEGEKIPWAKMGERST
jgi:hypothetical protein